MPDGSALYVTPDYPNAFYCPVDNTTGANGHVYVGTVILPVTTFYKMWFGDIFGKNSGVLGDFAAGAIVAHEFGHSVQDEMSQQLGWAAPKGKKKELIADCFSGVWTWSINQRGQLEQGDLGEIAAALNLMGDAKITDNSHGTVQERVAAVNIGLQNGNPMNCVSAYWS
jgi:predicted metalloprotease